MLWPPPERELVRALGEGGGLMFLQEKSFSLN